MKYIFLNNNKVPNNELYYIIKVLWENGKFESKFIGFSCLVTSSKSDTSEVNCALSDFSLASNKVPKINIILSKDNCLFRP